MVPVLNIDALTEGNARCKKMQNLRQTYGISQTILPGCVFLNFTGSGILRKSWHNLSLLLEMPLQNESSPIVGNF